MLWTLIIAISSLSVVGCPFIWANRPNVSVTYPHALALAVGVPMAILNAWVWSKAMNGSEARLEGYPESVQNRWFAALYIGATVWIPLGTWLACWSVKHLALLL